MLAEIGQEQTYSNFKDEAARCEDEVGTANVDALHDVWRVMGALQCGPDWWAAPTAPVTPQGSPHWCNHCKPWNCDESGCHLSHVSISDDCPGQYMELTGEPTLEETLFDIVCHNEKVMFRSSTLLDGPKTVLTIVCAR
jgi:hypothetical protein